MASKQSVSAAPGRNLLVCGQKTATLGDCIWIAAGSKPMWQAPPVDPQPSIIFASSVEAGG
jgi:hypothetical protein